MSQPEICVVTLPCVREPKIIHPNQEDLPCLKLTASLPLQNWESLRPEKAKAPQKKIQWLENDSSFFLVGGANVGLFSGDVFFFVFSFPGDTKPTKYHQ